MDQILQGFGTLIVGWGAPGLVIAILYLDVRSLKDDISKLRTELNVSFENRIKESRETMPILSANTAALTTLTEVVKDRLRG